MRVVVRVHQAVATPAQRYQVGQALATEPLVGTVVDLQKYSAVAAPAAPSLYREHLLTLRNPSRAVQVGLVLPSAFLPYHRLGIGTRIRRCDASWSPVADILMTRLR